MPVYIQDWGSDTTGDGSFIKPYRTLAFTLTQVVGSFDVFLGRITETLTFLDLLTFGNIQFTGTDETFLTITGDVRTRPNQLVVFRKINCNIYSVGSLAPLNTRTTSTGDYRTTSTGEYRTTSL